MNIREKLRVTYIFALAASAIMPFESQIAFHYEIYCQTQSFMLFIAVVLLCKKIYSLRTIRFDDRS